MRRVADLHPGQAKTDARDAYIIADTARTMSHTLRGITIADEHIAELSMLCGFDDDLTVQLTGVRNRLRGLLTQIHPALERVVGPRLAHPAVVDMLSRYPTPAALHEAGRSRVRTRLKKLAPRMAARLADEILTVVDAHPRTCVLTSMPGIGVRTAARILTEIVGKKLQIRRTPSLIRRHRTITRRSGISIRGEAPSRRGNKTLKRALFLSAFASIKADPLSRAYYDRKRAEGKRYNQAIIALARRRTDVLYAVLRDGTLYEPRPTQQAPAA